MDAILRIISTIAFFCIPVFLGGFISLAAIASIAAHIGRKYHLFRLPSQNSRTRILQFASLIILSAVLLAHIQAQYYVFLYCLFDPWMPCHINETIIEATGLPILIDTPSEIEAIIRYLLPPTLRHICYTGSHMACKNVWVFLPVLEGTWLWFLYVVTWIFAPIQAFMVLEITRRKFPDERKSKRKQPA